MSSNNSKALNKQQYERSKKVMRISRDNAKADKATMTPSRRRWRRINASIVTISAIGAASCASQHESSSDSSIGTQSSAMNAAPAIPDFVLYAERSIALADHDVVSDGDVGIRRDFRYTSAYQLTVGPSTTIEVSHNVLAPSVSVGLLANIGDVQTSHLQNSGGFTRTVYSFPTTMPQLPQAAPATVGTTNITISSTTNTTLPPGNYGALFVSGSLTLTVGVYSFTSFTIDTLGHVYAAAGGVDVRVRDFFSGGSLSTIGPVAGQTASDLHISVAGADPAGGFAVSLGSSAQINSILVAPNGTISMADGITAVGAYAAYDITAGPHLTLTHQDAFTAPSAPPSSPSTPLPTLPPPPPAVVGCYAFQLNAWQSVACATQAFINSLPHPDVQVGLVDETVAQPLVYGQVAVTLPQVGSESDTYLASTANTAGCTSTGAAVPNQWGVQTNTNDYTIPAGTMIGGVDHGNHTGTTQFTMQSSQVLNKPHSVCIWNIDVDTQDYSQTACVNFNPRPGGLQAFDQGSLAGFVNSNGTLSVVAKMSWVKAGDPTAYATVSKDTFGLSGNWTQAGGGLLGLGVCSQAKFTNAEVVTQVAASTCVGDTDPTSAVCAPPVFQPSADVFLGAIGTLETNNLVSTGTQSLTFPNADLAVTDVTATTSGACLGPSHAYVKDSVADFGATPSNAGGAAFWESPDIFIVPHGTPVSLAGVSTETTITPGGSFDAWVRVHNDLGCSDVTGAKALVYLADPAALSTQWNSITSNQYVGPNMASTGVTVPAGGEALIGPLTFVAPANGNGHKCILAAIEADSEAAPSSTTDAPGSNQVAQRNLQFIAPCAYPLTNATTSDGTVQITLTADLTSGGPSLTGMPDFEVAFDDADSSWYNVWRLQAGVGVSFAISHDTLLGTTTVRLGGFGIVLNPVPLPAGTSRIAKGQAALSSTALSTNMQIAAKLLDSSGNLLVQNGGSCNFAPGATIN